MSKNELVSQYEMICKPAMYVQRIPSPKEGVTPPGALEVGVLLAPRSLQRKLLLFTEYPADVMEKAVY